MAIFGSTTLGSSYSDPMRALTIKALEKRQADMMAQQAQQGMPDSIPTPIQGVGHVVNQLANQMQLGRVEQATAARREELARVMSEGPQGPDGTWSPQQIAAITGANEELGGKLIQNDYSAREARAGREHDVTRDTARFGHETGLEGQRQQFQTGLESQRQDFQRGESAQTRQLTRDMATQEQNARADLASTEREFKAAQAELDRALTRGNEAEKQAAQAKLAEAQQKHELARDALNNAAKAAMPQSPQGAIGADVKAGLVTPEQGAAGVAKLTAPSPGDIVKRTEIEQSYVAHKSAIEKLAAAGEALKGGIYTGVAQNTAPTISGLPGGGSVVDKDKAQRTALWNSVINEIATGRMSKELKGQTTNFELQQFKDMINNPNFSDQDRQVQFERLVRSAQADLGTQRQAVLDAKGDIDRLDKDFESRKPAPAGGAGAPAPAPAAGGGDKAPVNVKSEAEALALPPGTRFILNGRSGTAQ